MTSRAGRIILPGAMLFISATGAPAQDEACRKVLAARIQACTTACVEKAKAAVAPDIRDRISGRGCASNCTKLEMFNGHSCP